MTVGILQSKFPVRRAHSFAHGEMQIRGCQMFCSFGTLQLRRLVVVSEAQPLNAHNRRRLVLGPVAFVADFFEFHTAVHSSSSALFAA